MKHIRQNLDRVPALPVKGRIAGAGALLVAAVAVIASLTGGSATHDAASAREKARGLTDTVTVPVYRDGMPGQLRPKVLPPLIRADGACRDLLNEFRDLFDAYPTASTLDSKGVKKFQGLLNKLNKAHSDKGTLVYDVCPEGTVVNFNRQEIAPWQSWIMAPTPAPAASPAKGTSPHKSTSTKHSPKKGKSHPVKPAKSSTSAAPVPSPSP